MSMKKFNQNVIDVIGNTPIVRLNKVAANVDSDIYVKLEYMNPGGSIKERIAKHIIEQAIERGDLKPGGTIVEGTSGNTGVGLAMYAAVHGFKCIFVLPDKQSIEKINNLRAFGAKVVVTPTNVAPEDPRSYYSVAKRIAETTPNSFYANQYYNLDNQEAHVRSTGPEIFDQTGGDFDVFMCGVGTGGTISGTGKYLKSVMPDVKIVGVDIEGSILAPFWKTGEVIEAHGYVLEGIGEDIFPDNLDFSVIDDFVMIDDKESFVMTRRLLTEEGIYAGGSSGAAVVGAIRYAESLDTPKKILVILPDSGNRYTGKIYNDEWMKEGGYSDSPYNITVEEMLHHTGKTTKLIKMQDDKNIGTAIEIMNASDISQIPVFRGDTLVGYVSESKISTPLFDGTLDLEDNINLVMLNDFEIVKQDTLLQTIQEKLTQGKTIFVSDNEDNIISIVTYSDLVNYIAGA
ncbi:MAG: pyridoxal-5'-phosphate-dependent protein subunit beta [Ignavibacteriae bacterium HGW-Ignavibacteriae-4]|jgi:cystathionine beta-synthase|nr:MAG: pyridoxal-5'-phosphate-dependent protein subunit beta [Ignavibacteriae bacterium HGW-Ignavibacteriae-4]